MVSNTKADVGSYRGSSLTGANVFEFGSYLSKRGPLTKRVANVEGRTKAASRNSHRLWRGREESRVRKREREAVVASRRSGWVEEEAEEAEKEEEGGGGGGGGREGQQSGGEEPEGR